MSSILSDNRIKFCLAQLRLNCLLVAVSLVDANSSETPNMECHQALQHTLPQLFRIINCSKFSNHCHHMLCFLNKFNSLILIAAKRSFKLST